jgi:TrwC relaxase/AAA domain
MLTYRVGAAASPAAGSAMAEYLLAGTLQPETAKAAAYYTVGEVRQEQGRAYWNRLVEGGRQAANRTIAELGQDLSPAMAHRLGILDPRTPLTEQQIAHLLNATRLDGTPIDGRKKHSATRSVAEVFALDPKQPPSAEAIHNVLAGRRADGETPRTGSGKLLPAPIVEGARKRFKAALGVPTRREPTAEELAHLESGRMATGRMIDTADYRRQIHGTRPPVGFVDMTFSADKSLSVAWALARTAQERETLLDIHRKAVAGAMAYAETQLGFARRGKGGSRGLEEGALGWINFQHYTSRPAVDFERRDSEGRAYTETRDVPLQHADPQLHTHVTVFNSVLTASGHVGALDLDRLAGRVKEIGAIYHAHVATRARELGINTALDERTGAARLTAIPTAVRDMFSKRAVEATRAAREFAERKGVDWDVLNAEQKLALLKAGAAETRQAKEGSTTDFAVWHQQAETASYRHRTVLGTAPVQRPLPDPDRLHAAYRAALPMVEEEFKRRAVIDQQELRESAARSLIVTGMGKRPSDDIDTIINAFRERGVMQDGQRVKLLWGRGTVVRGKERQQVTTGLHVDQERELIRLAKTASLDRSAALSTENIERAVAAFLERNPTIDAAGEQWRAQRQMMTTLATGGRLAVAIGVAGSGKSTALAPLVDAWRTDGRQVFGITLAWRQAADLRSAGIVERASIAAFLRRVETGRYKVDHNSVVVVDELGLVGTRQLLTLLQVQQRTGAQLTMIGDPNQCRSVEAGPALELLRDALGGEAVPQILTSIRQKTEREREIGYLFRAGRAAEALEMKQQDGTAVLVAGGREATIEHVARLWCERLKANDGKPDFTLTVSAPTNADAREIGAAIRAHRRRAGDLGDDVKIVKATDRGGDTYDLPLAIGDRVRLFDRVHDADADHRKTVLANNGEVVEIRGVTHQGMLVRNASGLEGLIEWRKIRSRRDTPVRLTYAYATTVDTAQGSTATEHIHAMPAGSQAISGFKAYTAATRHQTTNWIVVDDASERRQLTSRAMLGHKPDIREHDVWENVAKNLSRQPLKASAIAAIHQTAQRARQTARL